LQVDEKWSFVRKKQAQCDLTDPADHQAGDCWDHVAFDPEHRLVLGVEIGKRSATRVLELLRRVKGQLDGRTPRLVSSDEFKAYETLLPRIWPERLPPKPDRRRPRHGRPCAPPWPPRRPDPALSYATVRKEREQGRVTSVKTTRVFGTPAAVAEALAASRASTAVNTSFLERHNATDRHRNARKQRRTYRFSKDWATHAAVGRFTLYSYNFCWEVRTLRQRVGRQRVRRQRIRRRRKARGRRRNTAGPPRHVKRTAAMAAGLTDHRWTLAEWLARPVTGIST
jgi:IS1 family transposase